MQRAFRRHQLGDVGGGEGGRCRSAFVRLQRLHRRVIAPPRHAQLACSRFVRIVLLPPLIATWCPTRAAAKDHRALPTVCTIVASGSASRVMRLDLRIWARFAPSSHRVAPTFGTSERCARRRAVPVGARSCVITGSLRDGAMPCTFGHDHFRRTQGAVMRRLPACCWPLPQPHTMSPDARGAHYLPW